MELKSNRINILFSYAYLRKAKKLEDDILKLSEEGHINLLIDSGAFTAYNSGSPIKLPDYIEACHRYKGRCWQYVALDVLSNKEETKKNLYKMIDAKLIPMPVLTIDEDVSVAKEYVQINKHIGVPGGTLTKGDWMRQRFQQVDKITEGKAKIHGLGYVAFPEMYQLPIHTVDSSTWVTGGSYGRIKYFDKIKGIKDFTVPEIKQIDISKIPSRLKQIWIDMGLNPQDRMKEEYYSGRYTFNNFATTEAYLELFNYSRIQGIEFFFVCGNLTSVATIGAIIRCKKELGRVNYVRVKSMLNKAKESSSIKELLVT